MSEYVYWISAVATDAAAGNALAGLIGAEPWDASAFDRGTPCYPTGTTFTITGAPPLEYREPSSSAAAWYVGVAAKKAAYDVAAEYAGAGPYPLLNARGVNDAQVAWFRARVQVQAGGRDVTEQNWLAFIVSLGYVL